MKVPKELKGLVKELIKAKNKGGLDINIWNELIEMPPQDDGLFRQEIKTTHYKVEWQKEHKIKS